MEKSRLFSDMGNSKYSRYVLCSKRRDEYEQGPAEKKLKGKKAGTGEMREEKEEEEEEMEMNIGTVNRMSSCCCCSSGRSLG